MDVHCGSFNKVISKAPLRYLINYAATVVPYGRKNSIPNNSEYFGILPLYPT